jgi:hypothetical protein
MSTIIAIFFALGIGILIGGTLGQTWVVQTENRIVDMLMARYENQISTNQLLQKQVGSLQLMNNQTSAPILHDHKIMWIRPKDTHNELLPFVMKSAGVDWIELSVDENLKYSDPSFGSMAIPDIILISEPLLIQQMAGEFRSKLVDVNPKYLEFNEPQEAVDFILYLKEIMEEDDSRAVLGVYRYPGLE